MTKLRIKLLDPLIRRSVRLTAELLSRTTYQSYPSYYMALCPTKVRVPVHRRQWQYMLACGRNTRTSSSYTQHNYTNII